MSEEKHTPGPWKHKEDNPTRIMGPDDETVAAVYGGMVGDKFQLANARLIAAAPSIYEYIQNKAMDGDKDAQTFLESLIKTDEE